MIRDITKEQQEQIPIIVDKWHKIHLSTKQYTNEEIIDSVNDFYLSISKYKPKIIILDSPKQCVEYGNDNNIIIFDTFREFFYNILDNSISTSVNNLIWASIHHLNINNISKSISNSVCDSVCDSISKYANPYIDFFISNFIYYFLPYSIYIDYCTNVLHITKLNQYKKYLCLLNKIHSAIIEHNVIIICRKLKYLHLDNNNQLHGDGIKAFEFNDGSGSYFNHGMGIPQLYGSEKTKNWNPNWLLREPNIEYKRLLIRNIGYKRISKELHSTIVHKDKNMELLEIPNIDIEPIRLLKVICPSTNSIYLLRVPPNIHNCEECRQWTLFNENEEYEFIKES